MKFIILGCGSSMGVPRSDGFFGACDRKNLKNFRDKDGTVFDGYNLEFFGTCKSCKNKQIENTKH